MFDHGMQRLPYFRDMKPYAIAAFLALTGLFACSGNQTQKEVFGAELKDSSGMAPIAALRAFEAGNNAPVVLDGKIEQVCQSEGCWFNMALDSNRRLFVEFGESFTVPKNIAGRRALVVGSFYRDSISVEKQREDGIASGKSKEELAAITQPMVETNFRASGVKLMR